MPIFDSPINTDPANLQKVISLNLPVILYLYNQTDASLNDALNKAAREYAGKILVARVDAAQNPQMLAQYKNPMLPAIIAFRDGEVQATSAPAKPADVKAHAAYLLGQGAKPAAPTAASNGTAQNGAAQNGVAHPFPVTDKTFAQDVLQSDVPVLVDFWAAWCGPCRMIAPSLENIAQKYAGRLKVAKLDVDSNRHSAVKYEAHGIPMLLLFKNGKQVGKLVGAHPQPNIERMIDAELSK